MNPEAKIYVAGHRGMVGSAIVRALTGNGYSNIVSRTHAELDLVRQSEVEDFFRTEKPEYVFLGAAKVGGIHANNEFPADFIYENLAIQTNVIRAAYDNGVKRLLFLGSSCIYPKMAEQPIKEEYLLTGPLEPTNRPYAIAKIAGIEMCWSFNRQHGTRYLAAMPTNLYGPGDNYHPQNSHVIPGLLRKFHDGRESGSETVKVWGTGNPKREFLFCDDLADACLFLMNLDEPKFNSLVDLELPPLVNIGIGRDLTIRELAMTIRSVVGYEGEVLFDSSMPDGTPRKLLDVSRIESLGWRATTDLEQGLVLAYEDFVSGAGRSGT
jgi:GDP-L-fucose synthase